MKYQSMRKDAGGALLTSSLPISLFSLSLQEMASGYRYTSIAHSVQKPLSREHALRIISEGRRPKALVGDVSELRTEGTSKTCWPLLAHTFCLIGRLHQSLQSHQSLAKHLALLLQGDRLFHGRTDPEKLTHFIEGPTEARCRCEATKPTHGIIALFNATLVQAPVDC
jgi:hypothetical protein